VDLASMAGKIESRANLPHNASKATVISTTKSLALAHAADGIRVNCVCPGFVERDMWVSLVRELGHCSSNHPWSLPAAVSGRSHWGAWSGRRMSPA
jgi:NAD(P)-dependent dehydrogenase (short-subunit alcohol dehydrogenase family)